MTAVRYASPIDAATYGEHPVHLVARPAHFAGRLNDPGWAVEPGRFHIYGGRSCPRSHRAAIVLGLRELQDTVTMSFVDRFRDARGWAFRAASGPDPLNGFTLLREAYLATDPHYRGSVTIPVLWDRASSRIVSNDPDTIDLDLAMLPSTAGPELVPPDTADAIVSAGRQVDGLSRTISQALHHDTARARLRDMLAELDERVAEGRYLLGDRLTLADIRLWTVLVRYDVGPNAHGAAGPRLPTFDNLWVWARRIHRMRAVRAATNFDHFRAPLTDGPSWD